MRGELYVDGNSRPVAISDVTETGMTVSTTLILEPGTSIALGVRLPEDAAYAAALDFIHVDLRIVEASEVMENGTIRYSCLGSNPLCRILGSVA
jgi:hypothetical protein